MAKKKNNNDIEVVSVDTDKINGAKNPYMATFKQIVRNENDIDQLITAISLINAQLLTIASNNERIMQARDNIIEAYEYAAGLILGDKKKEERLFNNWYGKYPLLFRMGSELAFEKDKQGVDLEYELLDDNQKVLFNKLLNKTWKVQEQRRLVVGNSAINIPRTINRNELEVYFYAVKRLLIDFLLEGVNAMIFALERPDGDVISALKNIDGEVIVIEPDELEWSYSHDHQTGEYVGAPDGEKYIRFEL